MAQVPKYLFYLFRCWWTTCFASRQNWKECQIHRSQSHLGQMVFDTDGWLVVMQISQLVTCCCHLTQRIIHTHWLSKASSLLSVLAVMSVLCTEVLTRHCCCTFSMWLLVIFCFVGSLIVLKFTCFVTVFKKYCDCAVII